ncbi:DUF6577 family protein [Flagellimonas meridianipacifica]|uniref:Uncharacterized protein n=1 Tax=Flagellimonas meridianipacifica TaxID=1080225 RepID=A0A2T0MIW3_9FLAO|nr:DUF6577 family protein [Allomuricauda pacifica]PRX57522.1 hypothetical protein CLV81_1527 [Allomuricauda pacifica]
MHINDLKDTFAGSQKITIQDIIKFYEQFEKTTKRSTVDWRIHILVQNGILYRISRGVYSLSKKEAKEYIPEINRLLKNLSRKIHKQFPFIETCLWSTKWLNEFMLHQPGRFYVILEVEREVAESVFYALSDKRKDVFFSPSEEILNKYVINSIEPIIITNLTTEAPTQEVQNVSTTTLEKILVDIYCDPILFSAYQGAEMRRIYQNAFEKYNLNEPKMMRYANRRGKKDEMYELICQFKKVDD